MGPGFARAAPDGTSVEVLGTLAGGGLVTIAFVAWERRAAEPMLPRRLFTPRAFSAASAAIFCTSAAASQDARECLREAPASP
jgi:hypothetical protein